MSHSPATPLLAALALLAGVASAPPAGAATPDCNIFWNEVLHDTFAADYRSTAGPLAAGSMPSLRLRLRVAQSDITGARLRVWDDALDQESYLPMAWDGAFDDDPVTYDYWSVELPIPTQPTLLYYLFEITDDGTGGSCPGGSPDVDYYLDDDPRYYGGGRGGMSDGRDDLKSFQVTVYDPLFEVPAWLQGATIYQIFPDRFRNGDPGNDPPAGTGFVYGQTYYRPPTWNTPVCDPRDAGGPCPEAWSNNFYGGDLAGITQKIDEGYFDEIGVSALYLNPIFRSPSNHRYDTANYLEIDPALGTLADFQALVAAAGNHGIHLILDGVFNHTSSDSTYFDFYSRYDAAGNLTSPDGPGDDDDSGACEAGASPYYGWFYFPDIGNPGGGGIDLCYNGAGDAPQTYEAWFGFGSLPKLKSDSPAVRGLVFSQGNASVGPYWIGQGASAWRLDVGGDVDCGATCDPANDFWEGFRAAVRAVDSQAAILGEEWQDASFWLLGNEWDSVMNYRFRSTALGWFATNTFEDNDDFDGSASGPITPLIPSQLNARLLSIWEDYPPQAFRAMMNLGGSHDTNRLRFLLRKSNGDDDAVALQRLKQWFNFAFTYAGAPTLYYGDEVALVQDGVLANGIWEDDPYNRAPYPWADTPGAFVADEAMRQHVAALAAIRADHAALRLGDVHHGLVLDDALHLYGFGRTYRGEVALVVMNNDVAAHQATLSGLGETPYALSDGTVLTDLMSGASYVVSGGSVTVDVSREWMAVLAPPATLTLEIGGTCPQQTTFSLSHATPGARVLVLGSLTAGSFTVPAGVCAGTELGIASPKLVSSLVADANGDAGVTRSLPGGACGALFQAIDLGSCATSNLALLP